MGGMGGGGGSTGRAGFNANEWQFRSTIDPEELFRKIFGDAGMRGGFSDFEGFNDNFGMGASQEVRSTIHILITFGILNSRLYTHKIK